MQRSLLLLVVLPVLVVVACDAPTASPPAATSPSTPSAIPTPTASASAARARSPHTGKWHGSFEASKSPVEVPPGAPDPGWRADDGARRSGPGTLALRIGEDGTVSGLVDGALGKLVVRGALDDGTLRAGLTPREPHEPDAMTGFVVASAGEESIEGTLHASSHDGALARQARFRLRRE